VSPTSSGIGPEFDGFIARTTGNWRRRSAQVRVKHVSRKVAAHLLGTSTVSFIMASALLIAGGAGSKLVASGDWIVTRTHPQDPGTVALRSAPSLSSDDVHVWKVDLDVADWRESLDAGLLSDDEHRRARRFAFEHDQRRFVVCRATLRAILGAYLHARPLELSFQIGPHGKPHLSCGLSGAPIQFNVSHSHELALVAVSRERELGVDVEHLRPLDGIDDIITHYFAPVERLALGQVASPVRLSTFYRHWTVKEAYHKACGIGLSSALGIDVSGVGGESRCLPPAIGARHEGGWAARTLEPAPSYVGALVVSRGDGATVRMMNVTLPFNALDAGTLTP